MEGNTIKMVRFLSKNLYEIEPDAFGLDISDESFKFAQLRTRGGNAKLVAFGFVHFPKGLIMDGEIKDEQATADILAAALRKPAQGKLTTRFVVCSLPEEHSFIRVLQLPPMAESEVSEAIKLEIEQNIPLHINDAYYDYQILNSPDQKTQHLDILTSAAPKKLADGYISLMQKCGLRLKSLEVESVSVSRALVEKGASADPILIIDLGATRTSFIIFSGSGLQFTSSVPVAGNKMVEMIMAHTNTDRKEAKRLFYDVGLDKSADGGITFNIIEPIIKDLVEQIKNYIFFYESHSAREHSLSGGPAVKKILLCGGVSNLTGLNVYLSLALKIPVEIGNPWINILKPPLKEVPGLTFRISLGYTTALGLALSGVQKA